MFHPWAVMDLTQSVLPTWKVAPFCGMCKTAGILIYIDLCIDGKGTVSLIFKSIQALVMITNCIKQDSCILWH